MSTGIAVSDPVVSHFTEFKKSSNPNRYVIYAIENNSINMLKESGTTETFDDFLAELPAEDCRYALYKCDFTTTDGRPAQKIVHISWIPDAASVKKKMVYAGSKDALNKAMVGIATKINATDFSELTPSIVEEACRKFA